MNLSPRYVMLIIRDCKQCPFNVSKFKKDENDCEIRLPESFQYCTELECYFTEDEDQMDFLCPLQHYME